MNLDRQSKDTYVWPLLLVRAVEDIKEDIGLCGRLDGNTGEHPLVVDVPDEFPGAGLELRCLLGTLGRC